MPDQILSQFCAISRNFCDKVIVEEVVSEFFSYHRIGDLPRFEYFAFSLIDVSNRNSVYRKDESISQAEYLQTLLPRSAVIKAFNVLSAYALESGGLQGEFAFAIILTLSKL